MRHLIVKRVRRDAKGGQMVEFMVSETVDNVVEAQPAPLNLLEEVELLPVDSHTAQAIQTLLDRMNGKAEGNPVPFPSQLSFGGVAPNAGRLPSSRPNG